MADLFALVHREAGLVETFLSRGEAEAARDQVLLDEPGWADELSVELFEFILGEDA